MFVGLFCATVFLVVEIQGSSIVKRLTIPEDCELQAGTNKCHKYYLCGKGEYKQPFQTMLICKNVPLQSRCSVPLRIGECGKNICPCQDHKGNLYKEGETYLYGEINGAGELFECTCNKDSVLCGADCQRVERVPVQKPRPPLTFPWEW